MAAKVGVATVSYGIGVQNRYSAFLDDEDGFLGAGLTPVPSSAKRQQEQPAAAKPRAGQQAAKPNQSSPGNKLVQAKGAAKEAGKVAAGPQQKSAAQDNQRRPADSKRPRANTQGAANVNGYPPANNQKLISFSGKQVNYNQDTTANSHNNKFPRNPNNSNHHQANSASQQNAANKETNGYARFTRNNNNQQQQVRPGNRRPYQNDFNRKGAGAQGDDVAGNHFGAQSLEEEKRRREQKRVIDLRHKDPEKREARRNQQQLAASEQANLSADQLAGAAADNSSFRGPRSNRGPRVQDENGGPFKGPRGDRTRGRRFEQDSQEGVVGNNPERDAVRQASNGNRAPLRTGDRIQRNRNGFGAGSRGSRGSRGDGPDAEGPRRFGREDKQRPIPNFSDKLDFPSLAS